MSETQEFAIYLKYDVLCTSTWYIGIYCQKDVCVFFKEQKGTQEKMISINFITYLP